MLPSELTTAHFKGYPPQARAVAVDHLALLQRMPLSFAPSLLRELIEYDEKFPAERARMDRELRYLQSLPAGQVGECFAGFEGIRLTPAQASFDWVNHPLEFSEQLSAFLWSTHQMDAYRAAAFAYGDRMQHAAPPPDLPMRRLGIAIIGQGAEPKGAPLFQQLRQHGTYFSQVKFERGLESLLTAAEERAKAQPLPYAHWYVEGGSPAAFAPSLTCVSYANLASVREELLSRIQKQVSEPGMGPERLRDDLARLSPAALGMQGDALLNQFQLKLLTEGSGTQIFSTTFAQWAAREVLRRAEALTLVVRFAPRQRQRPMNELLSSADGPLTLDPQGSLIDADMSSYYHWLNQRRLPRSENSSFLVWFEGRGQALAIGPTLPRGTVSQSPLDLRTLLELATA